MPKAAPTRGMRCCRPPSSSIRTVPVACSTSPAVRKSRPLKAEWLSMWNMAPARPRVPIQLLPLWLPMSQAPTPMSMRPMFSTLE